LIIAYYQETLNPRMLGVPEKSYGTYIDDGVNPRTPDQVIEINEKV
jgi:hypothetical protein